MSPDERGTQMGWAKRAAFIAGLGFVYFVTAWLGLQVAAPPGNVTPVWVPVGFGVGALLRRGRGLWPGVLLGSFAVNCFLVPLSTGLGAVLAALGIAMGSTIACVLAATLINRHGGRAILDTTSGVLRFATITVVACLASSTTGLLVSLGHGVQPGAAGTFWLTWLVGDAVGMLVIVPTVCTPNLFRADRHAEAALLTLATLIATQVSFGRPLPAPAGTTLPVAWAVFIPIAWAGVRFAAPMVAWQTLLAYGMVSWATVSARGPFSLVTPDAALVLVDALVATAIMSGLLLAAARAQRERAVQALDEERQRLQEKVAERTASLEATHAALTAELKERSRLDAQMIELQKQEAIGRLAGGVAHDFNNLLTVVTAEADLLTVTSSSPEVRDSARSILAAGTRAGELTKHLLAIARRQPGQPRPTDVNAQLAEVRQLARPLLPENISLEVASEPATVLIDPTQLGQVLLNLVLNARDAMPKGGHLAITCRRRTVEALEAGANGISPGAWVLIEVTDDGEGISPELQARIFEPFFTTKKAGGHGLGLSSASGIVGQVGGALRVRSEVGKGSTFSVWLPEVQRPAEQSVPAPVVEQGRPASGTVLVVEDEPLVRRVVAAALERVGYRVLTAGDGEEALSLARRERASIDLLLTDVVMPRLGGVDLVAKLRTEAPWRVLFMSGFHEHQEELASEELLNKPFTSEALVTAVEAALRREPKGASEATKTLTAPG